MALVGRTERVSLVHSLCSAPTAASPRGSALPRLHRYVGPGEPQPGTGPMGDHLGRGGGVTAWCASEMLECTPSGGINSTAVQFDSAEPLDQPSWGIPCLPLKLLSLLVVVSDLMEVSGHSNGFQCSTQLQE